MQTWITNKYIYAYIVWVCVCLCTDVNSLYAFGDNDLKSTDDSRKIGYSIPKNWMKDPWAKPKRTKRDKSISESRSE